LFQLDAYVRGFDHLKALYAEHEDFGELFAIFPKHPKGDFLAQEGFLFKATRLCAPRCSIRELLITEVHGGSIAGHYKENKTLNMLREHYY